MKTVLVSFLLASSLLVAGCDNSNTTNTTAPDPTNSGSGTGSETPPAPTPGPQPAPNPNPNRALQPGQWATEEVTLIVKSNSAELQFACSVGRIQGKIRPNANGQFRASGTIRYFSNETGENEIYPAKFEGITSPDKNVIALRIISNDPRIEGGTQNDDYILRKDFVPPERACAF